MKNITTIALFTLLAFTSFNAEAQGNLQFNTTFTEKIFDSRQAQFTTTSDTFTVDSGKVWKISSVSSNWHTFRSSAFSIELDGIELAPQDRFWSGKYSVSVAQMPIWLSEGTHIVKGRHRGASTALMRCVINGIEFNLVQ
jgi:hypothetical protein